jgi:hypothetical protein
VLRQLHYWLERSDAVAGERVWVYRSVGQQWFQEFSWWSRTTVHRVLSRLVRRGLVGVRYEGRRRYFTIHYDQLTPACQNALGFWSHFDTDLFQLDTAAFQNRTTSSENRTTLSEIRTTHNKEYTEITIENTENTREGRDLQDGARTTRTGETPARPPSSSLLS